MGIEKITRPEISGQIKCEECGMKFDFTISEGANNVLYECPKGTCGTKYDIRRKDPYLTKIK